jgi:hypothetical protein
MLSPAGRATGKGKPGLERRGKAAENNGIDNPHPHKTHPHRPMSTKVPQKLLKIIEDIDTQGQANLTRLTVLKKWFERPERLQAFAIWMAQRAVAEENAADDVEGALFELARRLLADADPFRPDLNREAVQSLYRRLRAFQSEIKPGPWGGVRLIKNWKLLLIEEGLGICLGNGASPSSGYKLAVDYCRNYDPHYGTSLNGPSRAKVDAIAQFMLAMESMEDGAGTQGGGLTAPIRSPDGGARLHA